MGFEPIAIVGRGCVLPGALDPDELSANVAAGRVSIGEVPPGRWRLPPELAIGPVDDAVDRTWSTVGGYVHGFAEAFDPSGFGLAADEILALDPVFQWVLHGAREALRDAGFDRTYPRAGLVLGNLSFPSSEMARFAERLWLDGLADREPPHPRNRFCSGLPAHLAARALGLQAGAFALDAACASSLYAVKLACDRLHDGSADLMLAGAVNCADDLFIHIGFCALGAMSRSGQSRPFNRQADGLVPAEGAAFVALRRLTDALSDRTPILGVIRGVGLANDGRGSGLLVPAQEGQERAIRQAYNISGLDPRTVSLVECHATGTPIGDGVEVRSLANVFAGSADVPIGSLKSNIGHPITAAGVAGVLKVLGAMRSGVRPPTVGADQPIEELDGTPLRLLHAAEEWPEPRRAAVSAFGFGGNNAHLIIDEWVGERPVVAAVPPLPVRVSRAPIAIVALGARVADGASAADLARALFAGRPRLDPRRTVEIALAGLRFPPRDLEHTLAQQLLVLEAAREAVEEVRLPRERTMVLVGMGCDPEVARYGTRWRLPAVLAPHELAAAELAALTDSFRSPLLAPGVLGTMPNIVTNRLNAQFDLAGPSFSISAEEASGLVAMEVAVRALATGEVDAALVGAVDLSHEPVHQAALTGLERGRPPGDAAVVLVLKRLTDAERDGDPVLSVLGEDPGVPGLVVGDAGAGFDPGRLFGYAHAATGLVAVACAVLALRHGRRPRVDEPAQAWVGPPTAEVAVTVLDAPPVRLRLAAASGAVPAPVPVPLPEDRRTSGDQLSLPAHPAPVRLVLPESAAETMEPAPWLPSVPESSIVDEPLVTAGGVAPAHTAVAYVNHLMALHREFMARQAGVHDQFLRVRQHAEAVLLGVRGAATGNGLRPTLEPVAPPAPKQVRHPRRFDRAQLEELASGTISVHFGPMFAEQDSYRRQVRMPQPPLLLADRVLDIDAEPGSMGTGTIWTETDVRVDAWYIGPDGRMPAGIMIEAGQADLLLISWLGVDLLNRGERVYRLLGCEVTYHGSPAIPGETLSYDIHVDGHARQGDVRLFFFHYDGRVGGELRLSVREGQAGFFTDAELAGSGGVLWDPADEPPEGVAPQPLPTACTRRAFDHDAVTAFAEGRPVDCFGPGWESTQAHVRTPRIATGRMLLLDEVTGFDPAGGPWGRGYLRAETLIAADDWYFAGHFKGDPCMPGTLMFEGCMAAMAFCLAALGLTIERDGWRFEPVPGRAYRLRCRGQVTPQSRRVTYEVFVAEAVAGPEPALYADLLCTVDGVKAFHARRMGLRLVPDWPLDRWRELNAPAVQPTGEPVPLPALGGLRGYREPRPVAVVDGFEYGYPALLACAWGRPSQMFGPAYESYDSARRIARLPGPPYHFMSRVLAVHGPAGGQQPRSWAEVEYDLPAQAWYWEQSDFPTMPFCVLLETALQPCGWLASYARGALDTDVDLLFRNLDGTGTVFAEITPGAATVRTRTELSSLVSDAGVILVSFAVRCSEGDRLLFEATTRFGFFPPEALADQVGLPPSESEQAQREELARLAEQSQYLVDLRTRPQRYFGGSARMPGPMLLMLDRVTGYWPGAGRAGLGRLVAEKDVDPGEWFFKAHFFTDPVQPGSLGLEAMLQLLQFYLIERELAAGLPNPRFEPLMLGRALTWKYRGQVVPSDKLIRVELEVTEIGVDERGRYAVAEASLWVDGRRIYRVDELGLRVVPGDGVELLDPAVDTWLADHAPTWTVPALAMMSMVDRLAAAAERTGKTVTGLRDVQVRRWLPMPGPVWLRTEVGSPEADADRVDVNLLVWRDAATPGLSRFEPLATGTVHTGRLAGQPHPLPPLDEAEEVADPYTSGTLPHGPAYRYLTSLRIGSAGSSGVLDAGRGRVPRGQLHQGLLDAATHVIPHAELWRWSSRIGRYGVGYPHRVVELDVHEPLPDAGEVRVEARFAGFDAEDPLRPMVDLQFQRHGRVLVAMRLVEALVPKGRLGSAEPRHRRAFLRERAYAGGLGLSTTHEDGQTELTPTDVLRSDWLTGTVVHAYGLAGSERGVDHVAEIAVRDHVGRLARVHPSAVVPETDLSGARPASRPLELHRVNVDVAEGGRVSVRGLPPVQDLSIVRDWWRQRLPVVASWPAEDLCYGLAERFLDNVIYTDPRASAALRGRSCLYLANHQVGVESMVFAVVLSALGGSPVLTVAKAEHRQSWIGHFIDEVFSYPGITDPGLIAYVDRSDPYAVARAFRAVGDELSAGKSVLVHTDGTRALSCRQPVSEVSASLLDAALRAGVPVVPVRFAGGLPVEPARQRLELPVGYGRQEYWIGAPVLPETLAAMEYRERRTAVLAAMNGLGPGSDGDCPAEPDPGFAARVRDWMQRTGATHENAVTYLALTDRAAPTPGIRRLLDAAEAGQFVAGQDRESQWLGRLAQRLFGPRGPRVEQE
jgi:3-oxoacyl-(acyl-carrier-protein) synthase/3-hydroxymyristoyl/3-hydroxydecanoyl-(acyl carrier protein) dehydratase/1-acyl-sn-glycerol-3-phosphate acyltransferase